MVDGRFELEQMAVEVSDDVLLVPAAVHFPAAFDRVLQAVRVFLDGAADGRDLFREVVLQVVEVVALGGGAKVADLQFQVLGELEFDDFAVGRFDRRRKSGQAVEGADR